MSVLTQKSVDAIQATGELFWIWDDNVPNFGVRVMPSGTASYFVKYRVKNGPYRTHTIDRTNRITLKEARTKAMDLVTQNRKGVDPRAGQAGDITVADLLDRYLKEHACVHKKASSIKSDSLMIRKYLKPEFGKVKVSKIARTHIHHFHWRMAHFPVMANRCLALMSKAMNLAEVWGLRPDGSNPCRHIRKYNEKPRSVSIENEDIGKIAKAIESHKNRQYALALKAIFATGCRKNEILQARFDDVDLDRRELYLSDSKTGEGTIYLNNVALEAFREAMTMRTMKNGFVFGGARSNIQRAWRAIRKSAGLPDLHIHDLRHIFGSIAHEEGGSQKTVADLLRHKQLVTTERYLHSRKTEVKEASERTGEAISRFLRTLKRAPRSIQKVAGVKPFPRQSHSFS